jgi:tetratricopeptide (TPR) repeat protein
LNPFRTLLLLGCISAVPALAFAQERSSVSVPLTPRDQIQDCLRDLWRKPVFWDHMALGPVDPSVCKADPAKMEEALKEQHLIAFRLSQSVLLVDQRSFDKNQPLYYEWRTPEIIIRIAPTDRGNPGSRPPTETELREIGETILRKVHLPPLVCPYRASEGQIGRTALSILVEINRLHINSVRESVIARVVGSDLHPDYYYITGNGRIVYGELQEGHFQYLWESPLLGGANWTPEFWNLLHNGNLQIAVTSFVDLIKPENTELDAFFAFDLDGTEITRQPSTCEFYSVLAQHSATACPIRPTTHVQSVTTADGPDELVTTDESGKEIDYIFKNGRYHWQPQDMTEEAALNLDGLQYLKRGQPGEAAKKFVEASSVDPTNAEFANNAGYAYYKLGDYDQAVTWIQKAVQTDPRRAVAYLNLGDALLKLSQPRMMGEVVEPAVQHQRELEAKKSYEKYLELAPASKQAAEVKKRIANLPTPPPPTPAELNEQGMRLMSERKYLDAAGKFWDAYIHNEDEHYTALYEMNLGIAYYNAGNYDRAAEYLWRVIEIDPKRMTAYLSLGDALAKLNRNGEARQVYTKYLERAPDSKSAADVKKKLEALPQSP